MKTKSHASKARVSKIPPKSQSMLALAISELTRTTDAVAFPPAPSQPNPQNIINHAIMLEPPPSPVTCNGKDCTLSIDECGGIHWFDNIDGKLYCPICSHKSAIAEFEQAKKQVELAGQVARARRKCMYAFVGAAKSTSRQNLQEPLLVDTSHEPALVDTAQQQMQVDTSQEPVLVDTSQEPELCGKNDVSGEEGVCKEKNKSVVDSIIVESSDENGNNVNGNTGVDIGGKNGVSVSNQQCSSVLVESSDHNCDGGENVSKETSHDNWDGDEEQVGRRSTDENDHDASVAQVDSTNPRELGKRPLGCDEASGGEEASKERSDDNWDGGEEDLGLPTQQVGQRRTDENENDASVARVGNTNSRVLRKRPLKTSPGCDEVSTSRKCNDNCDGGGEEATKERSDDNLDGDAVDLGLPTQQVGRSTDENNHNASVARAGNTNPTKQRKRPLETSPGRDELSSSINSARSSGLNRKRQRWTPEEVEMLNEAVEKSSAKGLKNTSWKCVLEYGRHVFKSSRTSIDLRDKWRTMSKGPRAKKT